MTGLRPLDANRLKKAAFTEMIRIIQEETPSKPSTRLSTDASLPSLAALRQTEPKRLMSMLRGELDWVVMKCLEKRRERRYETANALARDLQRYLADEPVEARPPSTTYRLGKFFRRHKGPVVSASLVVLALIGGLLGTGMGLMRTEQARRAEAAQRQLAYEAQARAEQQRDRATQSNASLDTANDRLKHSTSRSEFTTGNHYIEADELAKGIAHLARSLRTDPTYWPAATRVVSALTDRGIAVNDLPPITHDEPIYDSVLDRTTGLLATRGEDYDLRIWNAWTAEKLMDVPATGNRMMPSLSPDGRRVVFVDPTGTALVYEPLTNPRTPLAVLKADSPVVQAVVNPTAGSKLTVATRHFDGTVQLWDGETGVSLGEPFRIQKWPAIFVRMGQEPESSGMRLIENVIADGITERVTIEGLDCQHIVTKENAGHAYFILDDQHRSTSEVDAFVEAEYWDEGTGRVRFVSGMRQMVNAKRKFAAASGCDGWTSAQTARAYWPPARAPTVSLRPSMCGNLRPETANE